MPLERRVCWGIRYAVRRRFSRCLGTILILSARKGILRSDHRMVADWLRYSKSGALCQGRTGGKAR